MQVMYTTLEGTDYSFKPFTRLNYFKLDEHLRELGSLCNKGSIYF